MNPVSIEYVAEWNDAINIVCCEINDEAERIADALEAKDIPYEFCEVVDDPNYDGNVALVLLGLSGATNVLEGDPVAGYVFDTNAAIALINDQKYGHLVVNGVDYVQVSDLFCKMITLYDFDVFCRNEYATESISTFASFHVDEFNETGSVSDSELNPACVILSNKTQLMDAAQQSAYKVYEMYDNVIKSLFAKDHNAQ